MRAVLDACVLFPTVLRDILIGLAAQGAIEPLWSARILAEWQHAAARRGPEAAALASAEIAQLRAAFPSAEIPADAALEAQFSLPDPADAHVLATALSASAERIVTLNLRDFPARALAPHSVTAQSPDDALIGLWLNDPDLVRACVETAVANRACATGRDQPLRALLKRAKLPRLGKALAPQP